MAVLCIVVIDGSNLVRIENTNFVALKFYTKFNILDLISELLQWRFVDSKL